MHHTRNQREIDNRYKTISANYLVLPVIRNFYLVEERIYCLKNMSERRLYVKPIKIPKILTSN
jgi:hypothetical protein